MALPFISGEFTIVADPELRFGTKGQAWAKVRCVAKDRTRDSNGNWADGDPLFIDVIINAGSENLIESAVKGDSIMVSGRLKQREYEVDGQKRTTYQIAADSIGVSLRFHPAKTSRSMGTDNIAAARDALGATEVAGAPF